MHKSFVLEFISQCGIHPSHHIKQYMVGWGIGVGGFLGFFLLYRLLKKNIQNNMTDKQPLSLMKNLKIVNLISLD